jgi:hypothetical protein
MGRQRAVPALVTEVPSMLFRTAAVALAITTITLGACAKGVASSPSLTPPATPAHTSTSVLATVDPTPTASPTGTRLPSSTSPGSPSPSAACVVPTTVAGLAGWPGSPLIEDILSCFGERDFIVTGYLAPPWGIGGLPNGVVPSWLGEWAGLEVVLWQKPRPAEGCVSDTDCLWMFIHAPDPATVPLSPERWVTLTGHFDDPLASTCRATGDGSDAVKTDAEAVETCRGHFVVTEIRTVAPPG